MRLQREDLDFVVRHQGHEEHARTEFVYTRLSLIEPWKRTQAGLRRREHEPIDDADVVHEIGFEVESIQEPRTAVSEYLRPRPSRVGVVANQEAGEREISESGCVYPRQIRLVVARFAVLEDPRRGRDPPCLRAHDTDTRSASGS